MNIKNLILGVIIPILILTTIFGSAISFALIILIGAFISNINIIIIFISYLIGLIISLCIYVSELHLNK